MDLRCRYAQDPADPRFNGLPAGLVIVLTSDFAENYRHDAEQAAWFDQIRELAACHGFAPTPKEFKKNPDAYPGALREAANTVRVAVTGSTRSPDLHAVAVALGAGEVLRRVRAVTA